MEHTQNRRALLVVLKSAPGLNVKLAKSGVGGNDRTKICLWEANSIPIIASTPLALVFGHSGARARQVV